MKKCTIDPDHSVAAFAIRHMGIAMVRGMFHKLSGCIYFDSEDIARSTVEAEIEVTSLSTGIKKRDEHVLSDEMLDAANYPAITFRSTRVVPVGKGRATVHGDLSRIEPPDWITAWKQCHQQGFVPKIATIAKACLFPADVNAHGGELPNGITTEVWWSPNHPFKSSLTGEAAKDLCDTWTKEMNRPWTQPIGFKYSGFEIAADALKRAQTLDKEKLREAIAKTDMDTIVGHIKYNDKNYSETPLVGGQWVKGKRWPWNWSWCITNKARLSIRPRKCSSPCRNRVCYILF